MILGSQRKYNNSSEKFKIVTSFYPIYIITSNIVEGADNIELTNMTDVNIGCIHDYALTTSDLKKIEEADVFIENGLGLEDISDKIISSNKDLKIIDSSKEISNLIKEDDQINPHIWTSITNYIKQVENVTNGLKECNPNNAQIYQKNSEDYIEKLNKLKAKYDSELNLNGKAAITLDESFEYLGKELGLNLTGIHTSHEESTLSAETIKNVINMINEQDSKIIIVNEGSSIKNAEIIANETGAKIYKLNACVTGTLSKDAYINGMESNLDILKE